MQLENGGIVYLKKPMTKPCKICLKGKRYATTSLCYGCWRTKEREKREAKAKARLLRKAKSREKKRETNKWWGKKCWQAFVAKLKIERTNFQGYLTCYTCGQVKEAKEMQGGHCFHRGRGPWRKIDFDPKHIQFQDAGCNINGGGKIPIFTAKLIQEHGWEYYEELRKGAVAPGMTVEELKELYKTF